MDATYSKKGSIWRRWDIHLHAPGTLHNDQFKNNWDGYLDAIKSASPSVCALGITDYFTLDCYKEAIQKQESIGQILLLPNVELRLDISGKKWINFHLIFSPEDLDHISKIEQELLKLEFKTDDKQRYVCSNEYLIKLGKYHDKSQTDIKGALKTGAMQFKASLDDIEKILESSWVKKNAVTAVSGSNGDGTAALNGAGEAIRKRIESLANIIFSGNEKDKLFWLNPSDGRLPKPVVFSSDAHSVDKVLKPNSQKNCWFKGDVCFDTLKQIILEPDRRIYIGNTPDPDPPPYAVINSIKVENSPWFTNQEVLLNSGFVAIIGARGSGKTALADLIALGAGVFEKKNHDSFLIRAKEHLNDLKVSLKWGGGETSYEFKDFSNVEEVQEDVQYLSQHFVNRLCSYKNHKELIGEIERIIFNSIKTADKYEAANFSELEELLVKPYQYERVEKKNDIKQLHEKINELTQKIDKKKSIKKQIDDNGQQVNLKKADIERLINNSKDKKNISQVKTKLEVLTEILEERNSNKAEVKKTKARLNALLIAVENERERVNVNIESWKREYLDIEPIKNAWSNFSFEIFSGIDRVIHESTKELDKSFCRVDEPQGEMFLKIDTDSVYNDFLEFTEDQFRKAKSSDLEKIKNIFNRYLVADQNKQKSFEREQKNLAGINRNKEKLEKELENIAQYENKRNNIRLERRKFYSKFFDLLNKEAEVLECLYIPLKERLNVVGGTCKDLDFVVHRKIDLDDWLEQAKNLFDGRSLQIDLKSEVENLLMPVWVKGSSNEISEALVSFQEKHWKTIKESYLQKYSSNLSLWQQKVAEWLYSVDHISLEYGIKYKGVSLDQLSSGTKGIVLLLLYLVIDLDDNRPLIIDQPEENLDPNSVFEELVGPFRELCKRRQVIIVTHNPNLVVNTDADQVIVANMETPDTKGLPLLSYDSGSIENKSIRDLVCKTLEGGEAAFVDREKRYRINQIDKQIS